MIRKCAFVVSGCVLAALLAGCAAPDSAATSTAGDGVSSAAASAPSAEQAESQTESQDPAAQAIAFQPGAWLAFGGGEYSFFYFNADGTSGRTQSPETGTGIAFAYEIDGNDVVFHMGAVDSDAHGTLTMEDDKHITLQWQEGIQEHLSYLSADDLDTFHLHTDSELCDLALAYWKANAENTTNSDGVMAAADTNLDGTVTIQVYENLTDHNTTHARYTVNRVTATGTEDGSGAAVDLSSAG